MPRRKKNGQSPARIPGNLRENPGNTLPEAYEADGANNPPVNKNKIVQSMQEMFSHLDPEVIYIVLSECEFKVEIAMDSLLELSGAAEVLAPVPPSVSGFECTAAALLGPHHFSEAVSHPESTEQSKPSSPLTEDLDSLLDQELETLTVPQGITEEHHSTNFSSVDASLSSFPPLPVAYQSLPELLQSSLEPGSRGPSAEHLEPGGSLMENVSGASAPLNNSTTPNHMNTEGQPSVVSFTHLISENPADKLNPPLDLGASGRLSAFQVYKKQDPTHSLSEKTRLKQSSEIEGGANSKVHELSQGLLNNPPSTWNLEAPCFQPHFHGYQQPAFITPLAQTPSCWFGHPRHPSAWLGQGPIHQAPLRPSATVPKSWALPAAPQGPAQYSKLRLEGNLLVLLRGPPGSGKSTLARALLEQNPSGVILSTDDYFTQNGQYQFDPTTLGEAHEWNHRQAKEAFERGTTPIIIDNTNMQGWEMKPYIAQALNHGYKVLFKEPETWWKHKPRELERRTVHNVSAERIRRMLDKYERFVTVQSVMGSQMPEWKHHHLLENTSSQPTSSETPDLIEQPALTGAATKTRPQMSSSLPDVSTVGRFGEVEMLDDGLHKSAESLNFQLSGKLTENLDVPDRCDVADFRELNSNLDTQFELQSPLGDQGIPDCIVELVMNDDLYGDEVSVAFSESIGQRVRREKSNRSSDINKVEPTDLVKDTNDSDSAAKESEEMKEDEGAGVVRNEEKKELPKTLNFVGDWPSEESLEQRQVRKGERTKQDHGKEDEVSQEENQQPTSRIAGSCLTEFQSLLDLIQTGGATVQTGSSFSLGSGKELETEDEAGGSFEKSHSSRPKSIEIKQNVNRGELPDCVFDWKVADSGIVGGMRTEDSKGLEIEKEESTTTEMDVRGPEIGPNTVDLNSTNATEDIAAPTANLLDISKTIKAIGIQSHSVEGEAATVEGMNKSTENVKEIRTEGDGSHTLDNPKSVCDGSVETESSTVIGGSLEGKRRRSGKQCKLALTFTQNCPAFSSSTPDSPDIVGQDLDKSDTNPDLSLTPNPRFESKIESQPESHQLLPTSLNEEMGCFTQTEPQYFALLWRVNCQDNPDERAAASKGDHYEDVTIRSGDASHFIPEVSTAVCASVAVHPSGQTEVPDRVVHEKGTQVEEKELGITEGHSESLQILRRHFKLVSFDTLEDLLDKCNQDLEWTTNLLLDSGERFFKAEDCAEDGITKEDDTSRQCADLSRPVEAVSGSKSEHHPEEGPQEGSSLTEEATQLSTCESEECRKKIDSEDTAVSVIIRDPPDVASDLEKCPESDVRPSQTVSPPKAVSERTICNNAELEMIYQEDGARDGNFDDAVVIEESRVEHEDEMASMEEVNRLLQDELKLLEREEEQRKNEGEKRKRQEAQQSRHLDIHTVELKLPTEVALQLTELFGPVGVDPGECSPDDNTVQMDLSLAKLLHQKWKETIQERQRQAALSFHLLHETDNQTDTHGQIPFMDHWKVSHPSVSLRDIMKEEQALQRNLQKTRQSRIDLNRYDGATVLKEKRLYSLFPTIDRHFLLDIFKDHNYSLTQTELFLHSLLDEEPVKTVVAPEVPRSDHQRASSMERQKKQLESATPNYQDTEDPEYEDFRAEASLQRRRQLESFTKAAEAYQQGHKEVASFYAQQGHLHGQRMHEANQRAAAQIFERVNASLLPKNILDLHGLHVDEALEHLAQVLQDKTTECEQGLCRPQLSIITGRGNHSQGGVARIRPAVIDYLSNKHYRFTEPKSGLVLVSLK
ncbi:NEDD4-binding protein 2 isoform 2-T2 [Pholidichthys leucotaenia]